jgi:hypothetical protein
MSSNFFTVMKINLENYNLEQMYEIMYINFFTTKVNKIKKHEYAI